MSVRLLSQVQRQREQDLLRQRGRKRDGNTLGMTLPQLSDQRLQGNRVALVQYARPQPREGLTERQQLPIERDVMMLARQMRIEFSRTQLLLTGGTDDDSVLFFERLDGSVQHERCDTEREQTARRANHLIDRAAAQSLRQLDHERHVDGVGGAKQRSRRTQPHVVLAVRQAARFDQRAR